MENKESLKEASKEFANSKKWMDKGAESWVEHTFIEGAKWQKNDCIKFINKLEDESFDGWSEEAISGYLTACMTIKQKYIDTLNGN